MVSVVAFAATLTPANVVVQATTLIYGVSVNRITLAITVAASLCACGISRRDAPPFMADAGPTPIHDAGPPRDGAPRRDDGGVAMGPCGAARPTLSGASSVRSMVIARDGTIYYATYDTIGWIADNGESDPEWIYLRDAEVFDLALDAANRYLYASSPETRSILRIDTSSSSFGTYVGGLDSSHVPGSLAMGPDGSLYYIEQSQETVRRVSLGGPSGTVYDVTVMPVFNASDLAFLPDGTLLVANAMRGILERITLGDGMERDRETFAEGLGFIRGIAVDGLGRVYVGNLLESQILRVDADGSNRTSIVPGIAQPRDLEFAAGSLDCEDLYFAYGEPGSIGRYQDGTTRGAPVPWH
jgi:hypothetical protein